MNCKYCELLLKKKKDLNKVVLEVTETRSRTERSSVYDKVFNLVCCNVRLKYIWTDNVNIQVLVIHKNIVTCTTLKVSEPDVLNELWDHRAKTPIKTL